MQVVNCVINIVVASRVKVIHQNHSGVSVVINATLDSAIVIYITFLGIAMNILTVEPINFYMNQQKSIE